ncbi:succinylglutamate desuccinylase/aspartoacylase family protein [Haladaptatus salinisoli]|uniref:succinylglutamate desuccinylase/aspartoacylase family protein n=1 Tax=Haladaptatus salinisoli TaxID=2884876 RepID=UPI001D0B7541|nr:succinylglutamate desuccinylase/aspartoacylase family protein [Haladaptatus salinisoli]
MNESRRAFLSAAGAVGGALALAGCAGDDPQDVEAGAVTTTTRTESSTPTSTASGGDLKPTVATSTIRAGTEQETTVYEIRSGRPGPTAFVVGGMHGNEESGYWAADDVRNWKIDAGTLVVLPEANAPAVEQHRREWPGEMDLNRQFPIGAPPKNALAREIWGAIRRHEPDVLVDLHSSKGILRRENDEGVGQNVFHSNHESVVRSVQRAIEYLNDEFVTGYEPIYDFVRTPADDSEYATAPMLVNKARRDRDIPSCLFEVTQDGVKPEKRARWTKAFVASVLDSWRIRAL